MKGIATPRAASFVADIEWGHADGYLSDGRVPPEIREARKLWATGDGRKLDAAFTLVAPLLRCSFVASRVSAELSEILTLTDDEVVAESLTICGLDLSLIHI